MPSITIYPPSLFGLHTNFDVPLTQRPPFHTFAVIESNHQGFTPGNRIHTVEVVPEEPRPPIIDAKFKVCQAEFQ